MEKLKLSAPWMIFYRQINALFEKDPAVKVLFDEENYLIKIYVDGPSKAEAIDQIIPHEKVFGNVTLKIEVIPSNLEDVSRVNLVARAFEGNPILKKIARAELFDHPINWVVFKKEVVQFYVDDLSDLHGVCSTLYQDLAKEIIGEDQGVFFCTDVEQEESTCEDCLDCE